MKKILISIVLLAFIIKMCFFMIGTPGHFEEWLISHGLRISLTVASIALCGFILSII